MKLELTRVMALWLQHASLDPNAQARVQARAHPAAAAEKLRLELAEARAQREKDGEASEARGARVAKRSAAVAAAYHVITVHTDDASLSGSASPIRAMQKVKRFKKPNRN
jgi:hypothetical protein